LSNDTEENDDLGILNLSKTQTGYVPLVDRFKSFPKDSENVPEDDAAFYYNNYANGTLEKASIGLLFPIPKWLRKRLNKKGLDGFYIKTLQDELIVTSDGDFIQGVETT